MIMVCDPVFSVIRFTKFSSNIAMLCASVILRVIRLKIDVQNDYGMWPSIFIGHYAGGKLFSSRWLNQ